MTNINESLNWDVAVFNGKVDTSEVINKEFGKFFKLYENFRHGSKNLAKKGTLVELTEDGYSFKSTDGNEININSNKLFESKLISISPSEYQIALSESIIKDNKKFSMFKTLFENQGFKLTFKKWNSGFKLYESFVATKEGEEDVVLTNPEIVGEMTPEEDVFIEEPTYDEIVASEKFEDNKDKMEDYLDMILGDGIENTNPLDYDLSNDFEGEDKELEDNSDYKVATDLYKNSDEEIRNIPDEENSTPLLECNQVVRFVKDKGITTDGYNFHNVKPKFLLEHKKVNVGGLQIGKNYVITDLRENKRMRFGGNYEVEGVDLFEFNDSRDNPIYLTKTEVEDNLIM